MEREVRKVSEAGCGGWRFEAVPVAAGCRRRLNVRPQWRVENRRRLWPVQRKRAEPEEVMAV